MELIRTTDGKAGFPLNKQITVTSFAYAKRQHTMSLTCTVGQKSKDYINLLEMRVEQNK